ncbi:hypothetical protein NEOKW01_1398 [Nematocida sp. AWRm80]|nr:hypothetical protein NEOKW01_1398 [Nematocida sp. AWRm80]
MNSTNEEFKLFLENVHSINALLDSAISQYNTLYTIKTQAITTLGTEKGDKKTAEAQNTTKTFQELLKEIEKKIETLSQTNPSTETKKYYFQVHIKALTERTKKVLDSFKEQENYLIKEEQQRLREQYLIAKPTATTEELDLLDDMTKARSLFRAAYSLGNKENIAQIQATEERYTSIQSMLDDLKILNETTQRLQEIIKETTVQIDTISYNTQAISLDSSQANIYLLSGIKKRRRKRLFKIIGLIIVLIIAIVLIAKVSGIISAFKSK